VIFGCVKPSAVVDQMPCVALIASFWRLRIVSARVTSSSRYTSFFWLPTFIASSLIAAVRIGPHFLSNSRISGITSKLRILFRTYRTRKAGYQISPFPLLFGFAEEIHDVFGTAQQRQVSLDDNAVETIMYKDQEAYSITALGYRRQQNAARRSGGRWWLSAERITVRNASDEDYGRVPTLIVTGVPAGRTTS